MVTVCVICGDEGIRNALIFCDNCRIYAIHRYCLFELPKNLNGSVVWSCEEDCGLEKDVKFFIGQCGSESLGCVQERSRSIVRCFEKKEDNGYLLSKKDEPSSLHQSSNACCSEIVKEDRPFVKQADLDDAFSADVAESLGKRKNGNKDQNDNRKKVHYGNCSENVKEDRPYVKQAYLDNDFLADTAESLGKRKNGNKVQKGNRKNVPDGNCSENVKEDRPYVKQAYLDNDFLADTAESLGKRKNGNKVQKGNRKNVPDGNCSENVKEDRPFVKQADLDGDFSADAAESLVERKNGSKDQKDTRKNVPDGSCSENVREESPFVKQADLDDNFLADSAESLGKRKNGNKDQKDKRKKVHNGNFDKESEFSNTAVCHEPQPMQEPIWRGSLNIRNKIFASFDGLVAHLSALACPRVHEQARMLPRLLSPDMLPRSAVWPKAFALSAPSYDSIAFYIFPEDKRSEEAFGNLMLEMIHQHLALRAVIQTAEILIFTSTLLPMDYWRFQKKLYLWGVFKKKKNPCVALDRVPEDKEGLGKAIIVRARSPVSTLIKSRPGSSLVNSPSG